MVIQSHKVTQILYIQVVRRGEERLLSSTGIRRVKTWKTINTRTVSKQAARPGHRRGQRSELTQLKGTENT